MTSELDFTRARVRQRGDHHIPSSAIDLHDLYVKDQRSVGRDAPGRKSTGAVAHVRGECEARSFAFGHRQHTQVPAANHLRRGMMNDE